MLRVASAGGDDVQRWRDQWLPTLREHATEDRDWPWAGDVQQADHDTDRLCLAIREREILHGMISLQFEDSRLRPGSQLVYVRAVATAPQNRKPPVGRREVARVGSLLMGLAEQLSSTLGLAGRVGLQSTPKSVGFYKKRGYIDVYDEDDMCPYFELVPRSPRG